MPDLGAMRGITSAGRWVAACACTWLIACGVLAAHHVASHPHAVDARGNFVHAAALGGAGASPDGALVQREADHEDDHAACFLTYAGPAAPASEDARVVVHTREHAVHDASSAAPAAGARPVYRLAPKTSPPSRG